ncbi:hypothetical protein EV2_021677 [Malus domestica]
MVTKTCFLKNYSKPKTIEETSSMAGRRVQRSHIFPEKGNQEPGISVTDLIFVVDEKPHPLFKRDGNDLMVTQKLSLLEALTGAFVNLTTLDGRVLMIPVKDIISKPGHEEVVRNEGMPISKDPTKKGNLRVKFDIVFPAKLNAEQKDDLRRVLGGGDT